MSKYPYPVLDYNTLESGYVSKHKFAIKCIGKRFDSYNVILKLSFDIQSNIINDYLESKKAFLAVRIVMRLFSSFTHVENGAEAVEVVLPKDQLSPIDEITITGFVVAANDFEISYCQEYVDNYTLMGTPFMIKERNVLGVSNLLTFSYNKFGESFVKLTKSNDQEGKGISFSASGNFINIKVGPKLYTSLLRISKDSSNRLGKPFVYNLILESMIYTFSFLVQKGYSPYEDHDWYKKLSQAFQDIFAGRNQTLEEYIDDLKEQGGLDPEVLFRDLQTFFSNLIETSIINATETSK